MKTPKELECAIRQYRHNDDNTKLLPGDVGQFVIGLDHDKTVVVFNTIYAKLEACENELAEMDASFELYDQSIRELTTFYHKEHPKEKEERRYPRTSKLVAWAVAIIERERKDKRLAIEIAKKLVGHIRKIPVGISTVEFSDFNEVNRLRDQLDAMEKDGGE